jgi:ubiquinone/menaquinone biosynthesis C-methylase UbiE
MTGKLTLQQTHTEYSDEDIVTRYERIVDEVGLWASERIIVQRHAAHNSPILDIGCGAGRITFGLHKLGYRNIIGIDLSEKMIEVCQKRAAQDHLDIPFAVANACRMPFPAESFELCIFGMSGLMTIPTVELRSAVYREAERVLVPGGYFVFTTCDKDERPDLWERMERNWEQTKEESNLEYGDFYFADEDTKSGVQAYAHVPTRQEILDAIHGAGLLLEYSVIRSALAQENDAVVQTSNDVIFWVCRKRE